MSLAFVQQRSAGLASPALSLALAYSSNTTAGSYLVACVQADTIAQGTISVSDNVNGAWTKVVANDSLGGEQFEIWHLPSGAGGAVTVTFSTTAVATGLKQLIIAEYTGQLAASVLDTNTTLTQQAEPTASYGPLTTNFANDELIWIGFTALNVPWSPGSGFNTRSNGNNSSGAVLFDSATVAASPGSYTFTATASSSALFGALLALLSAASQAATPTFSPAAGTYTGTQTVTISSTTPGGTIYYTTDGSTPTHSSSSISNGGTIAVASSLTVKAIASVSGFVDSAVGSAAYTINSGTKKRAGRSK